MGFATQLQEETITNEKRIEEVATQICGKLVQMSDFLYKPANEKGSLEAKLAEMDQMDQRMEAKLADMKKSMEARLLSISSKMKIIQRENKFLKRGLAEHEIRLCDIEEELEREIEQEPSRKRTRV